MALSLDKSVYSCSSSYSTFGVLFAPLLFLHPTNSKYFSIVKEGIQKTMFPRPYYHINIAAGPKLVSKTLGEK